MAPLLAAYSPKSRWSHQYLVTVIVPQQCSARFPLFCWCIQHWFPSLGVDYASVVGCCLAWVRLISASCLVFFVFRIPACDICVAELIGQCPESHMYKLPDSQPVSQHPTEKASLPDVGSYFGSFLHEMCYQLATSGKLSSSAPLSDPDRR